MSLRAHLEHPSIVIAVVILVVALFLLDYLTWRTKPLVRDFARSFALAPLDVYSDLRFMREREWPILLTAVVARVATVGFVLGKVLSRRGRFASLALVYVVAALTFVFPFALSAAYVERYAASAMTPGEAAPILLGLIVAGPILHLVLAFLVAQLAIRAFLGLDLKPRLREGALWLIAAASTWIWVFSAGRIERTYDAAPTLAFALALTAVLVQSVLLGAASLVTAESAKREAPEVSGPDAGTLRV